MPLRTPQQIRILRLAPGVGDALLHCSLVRVSLNDRPSFEAISYAWCDANDREPITCQNGI